MSQQGQTGEASKNPTVDDLLKMITSKGGPTISGSKPPPVPPKPKHDRGNFSDVIDRGFRKYFPLKHDKISSSDKVEHNAPDWKYETHEPKIDQDSDTHQNSVLGSQKSSSDFAGGVECFKPVQSGRSANFSFNQVIATAPSTLTNLRNRTNNQESDPIVTESPDETNNNNVVKHDRINNTTIVEILEAPSQHRLNKTYGDKSNINPTFNRSLQQQQQLFYENNSYAAPVVTSATDDDDDESDDGSQSDTDVTLPTEMEVESILNDSAKDHLPRTSTPTSTLRYPDRYPSTSIPPTNSRESHKIQGQIDLRPQNNRAPSSEEDTLNVSRDTDELTNLSATNNLSGGEVVGIYDSSDQANSSKDSPRALGLRDKVPYTVQVANETMMSSKVTPTSKSGSECSEAQLLHSPCQDKLRDLVELTNTLKGYIEKLESQVAHLTTKVDGLELQLDKQRDMSELNSNQPDSSISSGKQQYNYLKSNGMSGQRFSQSTSTINRLTPQNFQPTNSHISTSTFSRTNVATISRNSNPSPAYYTNGPASASVNHSTSRPTLSQSCGNTVSKSQRKPNIYSSSNSIYADSIKTGSTSISPTPNNQNHRLSTSPTSLMTNKRDSIAYASMLSLCSTGSTLKRNHAATGSVANLTQVGGQLSNWPSLSSFIQSKHRAKEIHYSEDERLVRMVLYNSLIAMRVPNWVESNYNLEKIVEPPSVRLKLDWVHGYRGRDCRSNIFYLPTGECIYFVASIVVLYNPDEKTQRHYLGHTDSVKCLAVHPNKLIIASGQSAVQNRRDKRPIVRVWNTVSLATLRVIGFNEDFDRSICCLAFSKHDQGATLAVVDESNEHTITLLDWQRERNWRLAETNSGHEPVLAIDFHPIDKYSLVAVGKSSINFWDTRGMTLTKKAGLFDKYDKPKYVLCLTFNDFGDTVTGDSNGNVIIWPRGANRPRKVIHDAHQGGVFSVLAMKDGSYLTGGRDRRIVEWDENFTRTGREAELPEHCGGIRFITCARGSQVLIGTLRNSILLGSLDNNFLLIMQGHTEATSALAVHPIRRQYLTGGFDDQIHLFDASTHDTLWTKCLMMPATTASFSPNGSLLIVGSTLGKWLVLDAITQEILFTKCDGSGTINCIKFSPDGECFAMGSSDSQIYVYQTTEAGNKFCRVGTCVGHSAPVKEIDWSDDSRFMQTQSMNFELMFWRALSCRPLDNENIIDDLRWFTHNCTIGFSVIGIWSDSIDSALISHCDKSNSDDLMVSVTDTGNINILRWPPCYNQCLSQKYYGNVEKFNFIKFLFDDSKLIAVGAKTCVTTEWIVDKGETFSRSSVSHLEE